MKYHTPVSAPGLSSYSFITMLVAVVFLVACGDEGAEINGENTVINDASLSVAGADGEDLTAINQTNFPIMFAPEPEPVAAPEPTTAAALPVELPPNATVRGEVSLEWADFIGDNMVTMVASITGTVLAEYQRGSGNVVFSDDTGQITTRIGQKTGCITGDLTSNLEFNGTAISAGTLTYADCDLGNTILNGDVTFSTEPSDTDANVDILRMTLTDLSAQNSVIEPLLNGSFAVTFSGDEIQLSTDDLSMVYEHIEAVAVQTDAGEEMVTRSVRVDEQWTETTLIGRVSEDGERSLSGRARLSNAESTGSVLFELENVVVPAGETMPAVGTLVVTHTDNSRLNFLFDQSTNDELVYTRTSSDRVTISRTILWSELATRVPLP